MAGRPSEITPVARLADVARAAGVSTTTVSVVLNGKAGNIPAETQQRVEQAARELGYRANRLARSLRMQRTHLLGLISDEIATLPYAGAIIKGAQEAAWADGYLLVVVDTNGEPEREARAIDELQQRQIDGLLYATNYHRVIEVPDALEGTPTVLLDARDESGTRSSVVPDEVGAAHAAVTRLIQAGHRRIGYLQNIADIPATRLRLEGYQQALRDAGIEVDRSLVAVTTPEDRASSMAAARSLLDRPDRPTALFAFSDRAASGAYLAAHGLGLTIPHDLSITSVDDLELVAAWLDPGLTTMRLPHEEMGRWAVERLVRLMDDTETPAEHHLMPCPIVERGSVAPPPDRP